MNIDVLGLIGRKRDGSELEPDELRALIDGYLAGAVADEQMSAFLMAGVCRGFTTREAVALTEVLLRSGDVIDLTDLAGPTVDKHSTGGVGDTTTLVVGPMAAACGLQMAKLSGRGLGHTGGTLDKLESIPGFGVDLSAVQIHDQVASIGLAVAAATGDLVPADKRLYALRDVTGTVPSPALIASSIMSKKLAGGAQHIVLDVKSGSGAQLKSLQAASALAELCVQIGRAHGRQVAALITDMDQPLSDAIGNALEVAHAVEVLQGERHGRLRDLSIEVTTALLELTGRESASARSSAIQALESGAALESFGRLVEAQGGNPQVISDPWNVLPSAPVVHDWQASPGRVVGFDCEGLGALANRLGAGRQRPGEDVDPAVGLEVRARVGDEVPRDGPLVRIHARSEEDAREAAAALSRVIEVGDDPPAPMPLLQRRVGLGDASQG